MLVDAADWIADQYQKLQAWARDRFDDDPRQAEIAYNAIIAVCVAAVATVVIVVAWLVISVLGALTVGAAQIAVTGVNWTLEHVANWRLAEVVTKPVHDYITAHAVGLPAEAEGIWSAWATVGLVLWADAVLERPPGLGAVRRRDGRDGLHRQPGHRAAARRRRRRPVLGGAVGARLPRRRPAPRSARPPARRPRHHHLAGAAAPAGRRALGRDPYPAGARRGEWRRAARLPLGP